MGSGKETIAQALLIAALPVLVVASVALLVITSSGRVETEPQPDTGRIARTR